MPGVTPLSVVIPVHNGARWIARVLAAGERAGRGRALEIIVVDDGGTDGSHEIVRRAAVAREIRIIDGPGRGAAAAINAGILAASHALVAQIDQDVIVDDAWMD